MGDYTPDCPSCEQQLDASEDRQNQMLASPTHQHQYITPNAPNIAIQSLQGDSLCPLCNRSTHMHAPKILYGHVVCKKCYYGFANRRQFAFAIDSIIWNLFIMQISFDVGIVMAMFGAVETEVAAVANAISWIALPFFLFKDGFSGYSPGKFLCGVRVINNTTGKPNGFGASFKRNLPLVIPFMPLIVAFNLCRGHRTGDGWSSSKVIWKKYANNPIFAAGISEKQNPAGSDATNHLPPTLPAYKSSWGILKILRITIGILAAIFLIVHILELPHFISQLSDTSKDNYAAILFGSLFGKGIAFVLGSAIAIACLYPRKKETAIQCNDTPQKIPH